MPGFSKMEQNRLATLVLAHRGSLDKMRGLLEGETDLVLVTAMRLAALFYRSRINATLPAIEAHYEAGHFNIKLDPQWLRDVESVGLTAGASTPETLVQETIVRLRKTLDKQGAWRPTRHGATGHRQHGSRARESLCGKGTR